MAAGVWVVGGCGVARRDEGVCAGVERSEARVGAWGGARRRRRLARRCVRRRGGRQLGTGFGLATLRQSRRIEEFVYLLRGVSGRRRPPA